ncbi:MAG TPA: mechanosensitive ion channel family protein [Burkholderiales bacterium]
MAWALQALAGRLIRVFRGYMASRTSAADELRRIDTVGNAFRYFASVIVVLVAGMLILNELGISIAPILATAGVAGIAIAFGAQSLIKDYFTGFFLLIEDQIRQGDVVEISGKSGEVEEVTLRYVRLRDNDGFVHFVPNGEIKLVTNRTRGFGQAVMDAVIKSSQSVEDAFQAMRDVGREMRQDAAFAPQILGDVQIAGIERWEHFGVFLRCRMKVLPEEQWRVRAEFMRRLKIAFEQRGVQSP